MYEVLTVKLNLLKHMKSKPRTPAYVEEVYHRIEVEMCTARNAVVALDLRIGHIVAKLPPEDQAEVEAALKDYNVTVCTAISKAGGLLAALDPRDVETLPKVWAPLDDPEPPRAALLPEIIRNFAPSRHTAGRGHFSHEISLIFARRNSAFSLEKWQKYGIIEL